jgi:hypothetical protein
MSGDETTGIEMRVHRQDAAACLSGMTRTLLACEREPAALSIVLETDADGEDVTMIHVRTNLADQDEIVGALCWLARLLGTGVDVTNVRDLPETKGRG